MIRYKLRARAPAKYLHQGQRRQSRIAGCLREVQYISRQILSHNYPILRPEEALSIDILCSSLGSVVEEIYREYIDLAMKSARYLDILSDRMKARNWCPARTDFLLGSDIIMLYITNLLPPYESVTPQSCGVPACSHRPQAVQQLQACHMVDCRRNCAVMSFDEAHLISTLNADGIPGISEVRSKEGRTT